MDREDLVVEGGVAYTRHYQERFVERVSRKSRRWEWFAQRAYEVGKRLEDIRNGAFRYYIASRETAYGGEARIYAGCVYWFVGGLAVTVYQVPREFRGGCVAAGREFCDEPEMD